MLSWGVRGVMVVGDGREVGWLQEEVGCGCCCQKCVSAVEGDRAV